MMTSHQKQTLVAPGTLTLDATYLLELIYDVDAEFDNGYIKMAASNDFSLYDTFDRFDATKWSTDQKYRRIEDGKPIAMVQSFEKSEYIQKADIFLADAGVRLLLT
jgi:hypothetical protein